MRFSLITLVYVARPGFWATHLWFYLLPLGGTERFHAAAFWLGAFYVMAPMGLLLYGWNDVADGETDRLNPRKGSLLFGAQCSDPELARLPWWILGIQVPFLVLFCLTIGWRGLMWFLLATGVNALYNQPPVAFKSRPVLDLLSQCGYLLVFPLSSWLNEVPQLPAAAWVFGLLFAMHSHLAGQIMDVIPDAEAGRRTTAVCIGVQRSKALLACFLVLESLILYLRFSSPIAALFLGAAGIAFAYDAIIRKDLLPTLKQMRFLLLSWNAVALASMWWIWKVSLFVR